MSPQFGTILTTAVISDQADGSAVSGYLELAAPVSTTAAALEDMSGFTFNVTLAASGRIMAVMAVEADSTGGGSSATGAWAIAIDGTDFGEIGRFLSGTNDLGALAIVARSGVLAAGTYAVQGRFYRRSGDKTVTAEAASLFAEVVQ